MNTIQRMTHLFIVIDVGNSRIKIGLFRHQESMGSVPRLPEYIRSIAVPVDEDINWSELSTWASQTTNPPVSIILGGVNPRGINKVLDGWPSTSWPTPITVENPFDFPLDINLDSARTVGVDRLLNAVAGNLIRPEKKSMIIVDSGTATTVDVISSQGSFNGGAILPGFQLCSQALHQYTALLPRISNEEIAQQVPNAVGRSTHSALTSGIFWGQVGAVKELVRQINLEMKEEAVLVITGGAGRLLAPQFSEEIIHEPFLTLQGLVIVAQHLGKREAVAKLAMNSV